MNRPPNMIWRSEAAQKVRIPKELPVRDIEDLSRWMQDCADGYRPGPDSPPLGRLEFTYELGEDDRISLIRVYFLNKHGKRSRFVRLRRQP